MYGQTENLCQPRRVERMSDDLRRGADRNAGGRRGLPHHEYAEFRHGEKQNRYAYDIQTNFHIVEVSPESIRRGNEEYMEMEYNLCNEFYEKFPEEDLLVSEPDRINNMENLIFEI